MIEDITERRQTQEQIKIQNEELQRINAEINEFFSIIAHDLLVPFNGFLGLTQVMAEELPSLTMAEVQGIAVRMSKSATNLYLLLENLLEWSRIQQGAVPFNPEVIQLGLVFGEIIDVIHESAKSKEIEIATDIPAESGVFADPYMLQTVIRNLVSNAIKFTPKGGKVSLLAKVATDHSVEISIQDTGIGMSQTLIENLFRIDVQTNRKGTEGEPSTGLGLLLCKEFVEKHSGKVWVESEEGIGSTFYFTLPYNIESEEKQVV
jgi:signal transduction histidine kinase